ncbi:MULTISPECIES: succinate dehydrogenase cytochrome b subunit [unclassified Polaribacter]|uniref:succinate dehydrogenase cytochrome b subunit n=1 Tax=unclassified Polaribacter TaxID=196858 RepID=UPI0011BEDE2B|nr:MULTISPECIES: succinate dehydrogenase cytochrome b subunit [unclassified Polaribacter]TXD53432.1 succinate dehydrogenase cytochrome b subunit [Polaribacter sp. IC063]TXD61466.1 succinate dehydrogenase cytochrome b subunit [Polaribacter sp. IC066]
MFFKKSIIALTGLFLCVFLVVHLSANCILLLPEDIARDAYNSYSTTLRESSFIKIIAYILYVSIIVHALYALLITLKNRKAKPQKYVLNHSKENSAWASKNMGILGTLILIFIIIHLANFWARIKLGLGEEVGMDAFGHKDVYEVTYSLFQNIYFVLFYTLISIPLALHLHHGLKSAFKTLGFYHKKGLQIIAKIALIYAVIMGVGFGIIPIIVYLK